MRADDDQPSAIPRDIQLLGLFLPEDVDRTFAARELCKVLRLDFDEMLATCAEIFARRRTMASEHWPDAAEGIAVADMFIFGIAYGVQLTTRRFIESDLSQG